MYGRTKTCIYGTLRACRGYIVSLTRKLTLILIGVLLTVWAIIFSQLHFSITANFQSFDKHTRDSIRAGVDKAISDQAMRMHAEARIWMELSDTHHTSKPDSAGNGVKDANVADNTPVDLPKWILRESDVVSLIDLNGNVLWSYARVGAAWVSDLTRQPDGRVIPELAQIDPVAGQQFFLQTDAGPQLAFSTPVTSTNSQLPTAHLVVAKTLNPFFYQQISMTDRPLEVLYTGDRSKLAEPLAPLLSKGGLSDAELFELEQTTSRAYMRFDDPFGNPVLLLAAASPRFLSTLPNNPGVQLFMVISAITIIYLLMMVGVIKHLIGEPLDRLGKRLRGMSLDGLQSVNTDGKGEFQLIENMFTELAAEREKRESSLRNFARAVETTDDAIAIIDWEGAFHYVNPSYIKLTGRTLDELNASKPWWNMVSATHSMRTRGNGKDEWEGEVEIMRPDGEIRVVEVKTYKLDAVQSENAHFVFALHDITEKNAQIAEIQRLATAVKSIEDCIIIADTQGRIQYANPAYEKRCGKKLAEIQGLETNKLSHAASPLEVYENITQTVMAGKVWRGELQAVFQDGREVIDEAVITPVINDRGEIVNYVTTLHDVTQRVTMEEDLRLANNRVQQANDELEERVAKRTDELRTAKEIAEQANVAKSAFLATVSHEIRTPLNGILGMLELLADYPLDNEQKRLLSSADTSAGLLLALINDILDFSKIEAGELGLEETTVSLREATESVVLSLAATAHRKGLKLQSSLDSSLPRLIKVDGVRLQQILLNLMGNAIKFTESNGGKGNISLEVGRGPDTSTGATLQLRVRDNGIGIPTEAIETLFKPFTQAESSTTRRFGGTGLGLSISARLVTLMGGEIAVNSQLGEGSVFTVTLPLIEATGGVAAELSRLTNTTSKSTMARWDNDELRGHILVAEDNPINQEVIKLQLKAIGFSCDLANDGTAALELWHQNKYDLVLTDCHMPNMDGFALARAIRKAEADASRVPIVALTANVLSEEAKKCRRAGMDECLTKPIERRRLDKALTVHLTARALHKSSRPDHQQTSTPAKSKSARQQTHRASDGLLDMTVFAANIGDDMQVQRELLRRFAVEAGKNISESRAALLTKDTDTLRCNAHKLKSAARTIGADRLADVCVEIEAAAGENNFLILAELIEQKAMLITLLGQRIDAELGQILPALETT